MELNQAFATLEKQLAAINTELHFNREAGAEDALTLPVITGCTACIM